VRENALPCKRSGKSYTWDFENRMVATVVPGTGAVTFKYDPFSIVRDLVFRWVTEGING
jgi:hypothetical protein